MKQQATGQSSRVPGSEIGGRSAPQRLGRDAASGLVSALVNIAYCTSFSALIFKGQLVGGLDLGLAALLTGSAITGVIVALTTSLPPADAGPDTPAVAVMSVLAATVAAAVFAGGGDEAMAVRHVLLAITVSSLLTGMFLAGIGSLRLGQLMRFVPYPVIGGFLAASGWLLLTGAVELVLGRSDTLDSIARPELAAGDALLLGLSFALAGAILLLRRATGSFFALPLVFFAATAGIQAAFLTLEPAMGERWFLTTGGTGRFWWPAGVVLDAQTDWGVIFAAAAEIGAVIGVTAIALLLDVSSLEVARARTADLDSEFRSNGLANVIGATVGGVAGNLSLQGSVLIEEAGGVSRLSGVFAALFITAVLLSGLDVTGFVPTPVLAGLLIYLGVVILIQALLRSPARRSWMDAALALIIMAVIIWFGYLVGVVIGILGACLMFAFSYSRIGVVRRHLSRAEFASNVERSIEAGQRLREEGARIQVFWLSGYIFFGSGNGVFERIRATIDRETERPVRFIVLDCSGVPGLDTSAVLSLTKLRNYCDQHGVRLVFSGLAGDIRAMLERAGFFLQASPHRVFASRNEALEWCEDEVLHEVGMQSHDHGEFESWLARALGEACGPGLIETYFDIRHVAGGTVLYHQGDPSETIDLVSHGRVAIMLENGEDPAVRLRRMSGHTVIGEMGFFRDTLRAASVVAEEDTVVYSLTRESFERMQREHAELATAFMQFIVRALSDRVEFANREISALI